MTREYVVHLLNSNQVDVKGLYEYFISKGGRIDVDNFRRVLSTAGSIESVYLVFMIQFVISKVVSKEGIIIKYY